MNDAVKILVLEHDPNDIELIQYELRKSDQKPVVEIACNKAQYQAALADFKPSLILSDFSLPKFDGLEAFAIKQASCAEVPFIFVSGTIGEEKTIELIKNGVTDYVFKDKLYALNPKIARALKEAQDINAKKLAEEHILKLNSELEERVKQRTAELSEANKQLETFSYSVSHDLRSPLRSIYGFSQLLQRNYGGVLDEAGRDLLSVIQDNTARMQALIEDMLAFSRIGKQGIETGDVDMAKLVSNVWHTVIQSSSVKPEIEIHPLPHITGDEAMLTQVWVNFISNAVKYSSKKSRPRIEIGAENKAGETVFFVRDNGAGFDMQYYDKLFGVFQRLHGSGEFEGTGVGLAIAKQIVEKHGGRVWAIGKPDDGATFYFSVPASEAAKRDLSASTI